MLVFRDQARRYGAALVEDRVETLQRQSGDCFVAQCRTQTVEARTIALATGVVDIEPELPDLRDAIRQGLIRHCPICDGYEVIGQRVAVIGYGAKGVREACFIRHFAGMLTLFTMGAAGVGDEERAKLRALGIELVEDTLIDVHRDASAIVGLTTDNGRVHRFDTLGAIAHASLARDLGVRCTDDGTISTDRHQRTSIDGVYACGDIVSDTLHQIAVAAAHAATAIHNAL